MVLLDAETTTDLNRALTRLRRGYIQYLGDLQGGMVGLNDEILAMLDQIGTEEAASIDQVWDFIRSAHQVPLVHAYDPEIARFNYTTIDYFLKETLRQKEETVVFLQEMADHYRGTEVGKLLSEVAAAQNSQVKILASVFKKENESESSEAKT